MTQLVLSLFPGIGLLDMAFEQEGFCVVRGPDRLWGSDMRRFHPPAGVFAGVIGGPPCQPWSDLASLVCRERDWQEVYGELSALVGEYTRVLGEARPDWFLMENVRRAPVPWLRGYGIHEFLLDNTWLGEEQMRERRFTFGVRGRGPMDLRRWIEYAALELPVAAQAWAVPAGHGPMPGQHQLPADSRELVNNTPEAKGRIQRAAVKSDPRPTRQEVRYQQQAILSDSRAVPVAIGGSGKVKRGAVVSSGGGESVRMNRYQFSEMCRLQGLPEDFLADAPFTMDGKRRVVGNGVPLPMGRAIARAVKQAMDGVVA